MKEDLFGGWGIEWETFSWIVSHLPKSSTILELGSGKASAELNRYYNLYSVEHAEQFLNMYDTNYLYAPYPEPKNMDSWYGKFEVPSYDLLLIDGPDHALRKNILKYVGIFDWSKPVVFDDVQESDLLDVANTIANEYCKRPSQIIHCDIKQFMVIP